MQLVSIIIINYNTFRLTCNCIESVLLHTKGAFEIILVDNASTECDPYLFKEKFPEIRLIASPVNGGFARGNNAGIKAASGHLILLLNPDTLVRDDSIGEAAKRLSESSFSACGVQQLNEDLSLQISGNYFMKGGINHLLPLPYWGPLLRWIAFKVKAKPPHVAQASPQEIVDWISGAFLMVKKEAVTIAGLMDEDFFLYAEEVEWCSRLKKTGPLVIYGNLHIIHLQGESINKDQGKTDKGNNDLYSRKGLQLMVSNHLRVRKQYGVGWFLFLLLNHSFASILYFPLSFLHRLFTLRNPVAEWPQAAKLFLNVFYIWKLSPRIIANKPYFYKVL